MTDSRFSPPLRAVLTSPEHSAMNYSEQNKQAVIEATVRVKRGAKVVAPGRLIPCDRLEFPMAVFEAPTQPTQDVSRFAFFWPLAIQVHSLDAGI